MERHRAALEPAVADDRPEPVPVAPGQLAIPSLLASPVPPIARRPVFVAGTAPARERARDPRAVAEARCVVSIDGDWSDAGRWRYEPCASLAAAVDIGNGEGTCEEHLDGWSCPIDAFARLRHRPAP